MALNITSRKLAFFGTTFTGPNWLKKNNDQYIGYLIPEFRQVWANYIIKSLKAYSDEGIEFFAITTGNEPLTFIIVRANFGVIAMYPEEQRDWIAYNLGPALEKANMSNVKIIGLDDQRLYAVWYTNVIMRNSEARKYMLGIGLHWYFDSFVSPDVLYTIHNEYPDQELIYTESSFNPVMKMGSKNKFGELKFDPTPPLLGSWRRAEIYADSIITNLNHWVTGYVDWNLALDTTGGPNRYNFSCDSSIVINETSNEAYKEPFFYTIGHFSKFFLPGSIVINVTLEKVNDNAYRYEVYNHLKKDKRNSRPTPQPPTIPTLYPPTPIKQELQYIAVRNPDHSYAVLILNPTTSIAEVAIHDQTRGYAFVALQAHSISTILYW